MTASRLVSAFLTLGLFTFAATAVAEESPAPLHEINVGILDHDTGGLWSGFSRESGVDLNAELLFRSLGAISGGTIHPAVGVSLNSGGDTSKIYAGFRYRYEFEAGVFLGVGLGAALHNGETDLVRNDKKALGSKLLFHIPLEIGYRISEHYTTALYFDHVSNGYTQDANEGLDTLGVRFGYRF